MFHSGDSSLEIIEVVSNILNIIFEFWRDIQTRTGRIFCFLSNISTPINATWTLYYYFHCTLPFAPFFVMREGERQRTNCLFSLPLFLPFSLPIIKSRKMFTTSHSFSPPLIYTLYTGALVIDKKNLSLAQLYTYQMHLFHYHQFILIFATLIQHCNGLWW